MDGHAGRRAKPLCHHHDRARQRPHGDVLGALGRHPDERPLRRALPPRAAAGVDLDGPRAPVPHGSRFERRRPLVVCAHDRTGPGRPLCPELHRDGRRAGERHGVLRRPAAEPRGPARVACGLHRPAVGVRGQDRAGLHERGPDPRALHVQGADEPGGQSRSEKLLPGLHLRRKTSDRLAQPGRRHPAHPDRRRCPVTRTALLIACGLAAGPLLGGLVSGLDRILTARMQSRIGPPLLQPYYDVIKLCFKEPLVVNVWQAFCATVYVAASCTALVLFFLQSDLLLILFVQAVGAVMLVVGALSSTSPFSQIGAHRELLQILSYEPLLVLVVVGIYLETGSFKLSEIYRWPAPLLPKLPFLFIVLGYALTIKLRKSPFDLSTCHHGHQELVKGLLTDYSGPILALTEIGHWFEVVLLLGICSLFWSTSWIGAAVLLAATYVLEVLVDNITARMNWRWMLSYVWGVGLTLSLVNLIWLTQG
ncbi:MAG: hypothetical protein EHM15_04170 [Desulfobacteraceae bacterium]|nr:MAG: hypothetical protein EHM15_04170 [Desulfobacteraceae bacterium]